MCGGDSNKLRTRPRFPILPTRMSSDSRSSRQTGAAEKNRKWIKIELSRPQVKPDKQKNAGNIGNAANPPDLKEFYCYPERHRSAEQRLKRKKQRMKFGFIEKTTSPECFQ